MKKTIFGLMLCLLIGLNASAGLTSPIVSDLKKNQQEKLEKKKFDYQCWSFAWTPICLSSPMTSSICGEGILDDYTKMALAMIMIIEVTAILCSEP